MNQTSKHHGFYCFNKGPGQCVMYIDERLFKQYKLVGQTNIMNDSFLLHIDKSDMVKKRKGQMILK